MSNGQNWTNFGERILNSVGDAISTGDFSELNTLVAEAVDTALQEAKKQAEAEKARQREKVQRQHEDWQIHKDDLTEQELEWQQREKERREREEKRRLEWQARQEERERLERERREHIQREQARQKEEQAKRQQEYQRQREQEKLRQAELKAQKKSTQKLEKELKSLVKMNPVGKTAGTLYTVFGGIGVGISSLMLLVCLGNFIVGNVGWGLPVFAFAVILGFVWMIQCGTLKRQRLMRADYYVRLCGYKFYGMLEELAKQSGRSVRYVRRDIRKMLKSGIFPEGHLDEQETCFMLTDAVYRQYVETAENYKREEEERKRLEAKKNQPKTLAEQVEEERLAREKELQVMVSDGTAYIRKLRELNDEIPGEPISSQLYQLESLLKEIFARVQEHPEQMHRMHKLMDYYLPTTVKLVEAYGEFGKVSTPGEDILSAQAEIEKTLGIINQAFVELLNNLFQDAALDVTTDAQVLQTMLAKEGLTRELEPVLQRKG